MSVVGWMEETYYLTELEKTILQVRALCEDRHSILKYERLTDDFKQIVNSIDKAINKNRSEYED